jgi:GT2 family glycosyltransferase
MTLVTAVVVSFNGGERTLRVLEALRAQKALLSAVIVVDNGSTDGTQGRVQAAYPAVKLLQMEGNR